MQTLATSQRIPISATSEVSDWVLIELNGELLPPVVMPSTDESETILGTKGQSELGRLFLVDGKHPMLILGSHQLKGKYVDLKEHFTVLEKNYDSELTDLLSYVPVGTIKKKLLFSDYPKVIMK